MKTKSILVMLFAISIALTSCKKNDNYVTPSGQVTTVNKSKTGFNELEVSDLFKVYITFSESAESVNVEANSNLQSRIRVTQNGDKLRIKLDDNIQIRDGEATLNVHITMRNLENVSGAGATSIFLQNELLGQNFGIQLSGACSFEGDLTVTSLNADITGGSVLRIQGHSDSFKAEMTGASSMENYSFETYKLEADLEGASNMHLTVQEKMDVKANGASNIYFKGNGVVSSQQLSGASSITKVN